MFYIAGETITQVIVIVAEEGEHWLPVQGINKVLIVNFGDLMLAAQPPLEDMGVPGVFDTVGIVKKLS